MKKSGVISKICVTAVFLLIALVISVPTLPTVLNMIGGARDFSSMKHFDLTENKSVEGTINYVIGYSSDESSGSFTASTYYYLVNLGGNAFDKEADKHTVVFIKTKGSSDAYTALNNLLSSSKGSVEFAGVAKKAPKNTQDMFDKIVKEKGLGDMNITMCDCIIDITTAPKAVLTRFLISLIFYAGFVIGLLLTISAFKRNREVDYIYHERAMTKAVQDIRSGANQPDGSETMFGDRGTEFVQGGKTAPLTPAPSYQEPAQNSQQQYQDDQDYYYGQQDQNQQQDNFYQGQQNQYQGQQNFYQGQQNQYQGQQNFYQGQQNGYQGQQYGGQNNYDDDGFFGG